MNASASRPPSTKAQQRAKAQRRRILEAAQHCFIDHGFHAATIANIADTAQVSAGLIYRYFENKQAIVLAIIEDQLDDARANIAALQTSTDLTPLIAELVEMWRSGKCCGEAKVMNPVLFLEMTAEASRSPEIARALRAADQVSGVDFRAWLERFAASQGHELTPLQVQARAMAMQCIIAGLAVRALREPDLDATVLRAALDLLVPAVARFDRQPP